MSQETKITARLAGNWLTCKITADRPIHAGAPVYFASAEQARGSWLAERIFQLPGVVSVKVAKDTLSVTRNAHEDWPKITRAVADLIDEATTKGLSAVAEGTPSNIPSPENIREKVEEILAQEINPAVAGHGGYIELIDVKETTVYVRLGGGCQGCGMANVTLKQGVERALRDAVPEIDEVLDVTDHASGANPYYAPSKK